MHLLYLIIKFDFILSRELCHRLHSQVIQYVSENYTINLFMFFSLFLSMEASYLLLLIFSQSSKCLYLWTSANCSLLYFLNIWMNVRSALSKMCVCAVQGLQYIVMFSNRSPQQLTTTFYDILRHFTTFSDIFRHLPKYSDKIYVVKRSLSTVGGPSNVLLWHLWSIVEYEKISFHVGFIIPTF